MTKRASTLAVIVAVITSAAMHLALVALTAILLGRGGFAPLHHTASFSISPQRALPPTPRLIDLDVAGAQPSNRNEPGARVAGLEPSVQRGGQDMARPDTGRDGRGGSPRSSLPAVNLADRDDGIRLARELPSHIERDQLPRIDSAPVRSSREDARATRKPMELTFLASGTGHREERRTAAPSEPSSGLPKSQPASNVGAARLGAEPLPTGFGRAAAVEGGDRLGSSFASPGLGVATPRVGSDHRESAAIAFARPMVRKGEPSIPAQQDGSPRDTVDSSQLVASPIQSLLDASSAGGPAGQGPGGQQGPGPTGSGGEKGQGSTARPMGDGHGAYPYDGIDAGLSMYQRRVLGKIYPLWERAFPRDAALDMRQGRVIISLVILADGSMVQARVARPSGIPEFDAKCLAAVHRAAPFEPIPANIGKRQMRWEISFDAINPMVR